MPRKVSYLLLGLIALGSAFVLRGSNIRLQNNLNKKEKSDLNNNQIEESYVLEKGKLSIWENSKMVWQSPKEWSIDNFVLADINNDGVTEINLSLWKSGNFGDSKPFWIKNNDMSVKNHFFVLNFEKGKVKEIWGSSNLSQPNCEFQIADVDEDGKNDLIVIEGSYGQKLGCVGEYVAIWEWDEWGFTNKWRSEKGDYLNLRIENNKIVAKGF
ncbi:MAG: hypothetical protein PHR98_03780 [Candidatus Shapirobacteria bacterium]|nr:hypothetical protein [Candidatus Shapirobacteria bacterium]